ncbi:MAG: hypothetical protein AAB250_17640 [Bdellovibrionota bacterium]
MKNAFIVFAISSSLVGSPAFAQNARVQDSLASTEALRELKVDSLRRDIRVAKLQIVNLERDLSNTGHGAAVVARKASLIGVGVSLTAIAVGVTSFIRGRAPVFAVIGAIGTFGGFSATVYSGAGLVVSQGAVMLTAPQAKELRAQLVEAHRELTELEASLASAQQQ